jgi:hypothetical protein
MFVEIKIKNAENKEQLIAKANELGLSLQSEVGDDVIFSGTVEGIEQDQVDQHYTAQLIEISPMSMVVSVVTV